MIITIDGPAGSGKSTAARKLAARLEVPYLDTGAMYRAVAYEALRRGVDVTNETEVFEMGRRMAIEVDCGPTHTRIRVDGHDVSEAIRTLEVSAATSQVARHPSVRELLVQHQRRIGESLGSLISEGRDQGSVVFPRADVKFVLEASVEKRAERRFLEMTADGEEVTLEEVADNIRARDEIDSRQWAPLLASADTVVIDTTDMSLAEVCDRLAEAVAKADAS